MREIKFRAWDGKDKKMVDWEYLRGYCDIDFLFGGAYERPKGHPYQYPIAMQFTGLKDKNGKEIYEGDIVAFEDGWETSTESGYDYVEFLNRGTIFYDTECGRFDVSNKEGLSYDELFNHGIDFEVIGNIYEHPHLLEGDSM